MTITPVNLEVTSKSMELFQKLCTDGLFVFDQNGDMKLNPCVKKHLDRIFDDLSGGDKSRTQDLNALLNEAIEETNDYNKTRSSNVVMWP